MTERQVEQQLRRWYDAEAAEGAASPFLAARVHRIPKVFPAPSWRNTLISANLKVATGAAAALVVAASVSLYFSQPGGVIEPAPSASPDPTPTAVQTLPPTPGATPEPSAEPPPAALHHGRLTQGTYVLDRAFPLQITFAVPDGWHGWHGLDTSPWATAAAVWRPGSGLPYGTMIAFWTVGFVASDPCQATWMDPPAGPTVDDLATAIAGWPELDITGPTDVTLNGHKGKRLEFTVPDDIETCRTGSFEMWQTGEITRAPNPSDHHQLWILGVDGIRLVIEVVDSPGTSDQDRAELHQVFESIRIEKP